MSKYGENTKYDLRQSLHVKPLPLTAAVSSVLAAGSLQAATITVDVLNDDANSFECSLRSALYAASINGTAAGCAAGEEGADTIVFASGLSGVISLTTNGGYFDGSTLPIGESVTIDGDNDITVVGTGEAPVFYAKYDDTEGLNAQTVQLAQLTITGGGGERGGGILSYADSLQLSDVTIENNTVSSSGGGVWHDPYNSDAGELIILASRITGNTANGSLFGRSGGGVGAQASRMDVSISSSIFRDNNAFGGNGGGLSLFISDEANVDIKYSTFEDNFAFGSFSGGGGYGGGIRAILPGTGTAVVDLMENVFEGNQATYNGGGLFLLDSAGGDFFQQSDITIDNNYFDNNYVGYSGGGALFYIVGNGGGTLQDPDKSIDFIDNRFIGNSAQRGGGALTLSLSNTVAADFEADYFGLNTTELGGGGALLASLDAARINFQGGYFFGNTADSGSGGAMSVDLQDSSFLATDIEATGNETYIGSGGAIYVDAASSDIGIEYSQFDLNYADFCGGGLAVYGSPDELGVGHSVFNSNRAVCGGALSLAITSPSTTLAEVKYSEFSGNTATAASAPYGGGAIFSEMGSGSSLVVNSSTISGNQSSGDAGAMLLRGEMNAQVKYSTIANNNAFEQGGGIFNASPSCSIANSILAGNESPAGVYQDLSGDTECDVANSLLAGAMASDFIDGGGNLLDTNPLLEPLAANGGTGGRTHALQAASPAIDAGSSGINVPDFDQRGSGFPRILGSAMDMGAFEYGSPSDQLFRDRFELP